MRPKVKKPIFRRYSSLLGNFLKMAIIAVLVYGVFYFCFKTNFFLVKDIQIDGATNFVNSDDIKNLAQSNALNSNLLNFNEQYLAEILSKNFLGAKKILVTKKLPNKLLIRVTERVPIAIVAPKNSEDHFLVDEDGFVLGIVSPDYADLPKLTYEEDVKVGLFINKDIVPVYLDLTKLLEEQNVSVSSVSFNQGVVNFYTSDGAQVLLGFEKIKKETIQALSQLITQEKLDGKIIKRIDLRYDKVIVSFEGKTSE